MRIIYRRIFLSVGMLWANLVFAQQRVQGIGGVAQNMMEPVTVVSSFISSACMIIGGTCLFAAFLRYMQYRVNPLASPISTVMILFIMGLLLVILPLVYMLTDSGIPFHLL